MANRRWAGTRMAGVGGRGSGARDGEESGMGRRMDCEGAAGRGPRRRGRTERRAMARAEASGRGALGRWGEGGVRGGRVRVRVREIRGLSGWGGGRKGGMGLEVKLGIKHGAGRSRHGAAMGRAATTVGARVGGGTAHGWGDVGGQDLLRRGDVGARLAGGMGWGAWGRVGPGAGVDGFDWGVECPWRSLHARRGFIKA